MRCQLILFFVAIFGFVSESPAQSLFQAVQDGNVERVKSLLESGSTANASRENGITAIFAADNLEIVDLLLSHGAKLNIRCSGTIQSPIEHFAQQYYRDTENQDKWKKIVERLRKAGAEYTIDTAIYLNDIEFVRELLAQDTSWVNDRKKAQSVPLKVAADTGRTEICKLLLEHKADPDSFEKGNGFPIMVYAVKHPAVVKLLIENGANLKRRITWMGQSSGDGVVKNEATSLHYAVWEGNLESVKLLIAAGLDSNAADVEGRTPLHIAIRSERWPHLGERDTASFEKIIRYLIENEASLRFTDKERKTPLKLAAELESPESILQALRKR